MSLTYLRGTLIPNGGLKYYDPITGWPKAGQSLGISWTMATNAVLQHDLANPQLPNRAVTVDQARAKLDAYMYAELKSRGMAEEYYSTDDPAERLQQLIKQYVPAPTPARCCGQRR